MSLAREAYQALESIVGPEHISQDPVVCQAYTGRRGGHGKDIGMDRVLCTTPVAVVLPKTTEEVQRIVKVANRYKIPFTPASSYWVTHCAPRVPECLLIDLKRMNYMEIDAKNMYAIVEPGVVYSQLQEQAMRRDLYTTVPGGGAQASVVANHMNWGLSPLNYRNGIPSRRILGTEWVLPDGELVRLGSLATSRDYFWGEGPGSDLRGLIRGWIGWFGSMGITTRMAVKLLPFQPERLEPIGISPDTTLQLPTNRMRWYNFTMPSRDKLVEAMYEIGKAEIAAAITKVPLFWRYIARAKSKEDFWEMWGVPERAGEVKNIHVLRVLLIGYTSEKQLEYEERILLDIVAEHGGEQRKTRQSDESWIKNADSVGMWWMTGGYTSCEVTIDTLDCAVKGGECLAELKRGFTPPLMEDYGDPGWFQVSEFGHMGYLEFLNYYDPDAEGLDKVDEWYYIAVPKEDIKRGLFNGFMIYGTPLDLVGPAYGPNHHLWMMKLKETFDPNGIANPPTPRDIDELVERAEWLKRDW